MRANAKVQADAEKNLIVEALGIKRKIGADRDRVAAHKMICE